MELYDLIVELKLLERRLTLYEEKYGLLSENFYRALMAGDLTAYDAQDETRTDFSKWKGIYETWLRRKKHYDQMFSDSKLSGFGLQMTLNKHNSTPN